MSGTWSKEELPRIAETDDLHISPFREDGKTYGTPTWIWSVVVDDGLYVRSYNGQSGRWYQAAIQQKSGRITAAGMTKEVVFVPVSGPINNRIDDAYRAKYASSPYRWSVQVRARRLSKLCHATRAATTEINHGNQKMRIKALRKRTGGIFHRNGTRRSSVRSA